jgi:hypothetical protein
MYEIWISLFLVMYSWLCRLRNLQLTIPGYVFLAMSLMKSQILYSWLCRSWLCRVRILVNRFLAMSCRKSDFNSWLCRSWLCRVENFKNVIPGYVVPGFVECEYSWTDSWLYRVRKPVYSIPGYVFLAMSCKKSDFDSWLSRSWLCRVENLKNVIPGYVVPEYVV